MPSRPAAPQTLRASINAWWSKVQTTPGAVSGDLQSQLVAWARHTLGVQSPPRPPGAGTLADLLGEHGDSWVRWSAMAAEDVRLRVGAAKRTAASGSPDWWAARLLDAQDSGESTHVEIVSEIRAQLVEDRLGPEAEAGRALVASRRKGGRKTAAARATGRKNWMARALALDKDMNGGKKQRAAAIAERLGLSFRTVYDALPGRRKSPASTGVALSRKSSR